MRAVGETSSGQRSRLSFRKYDNYFPKHDRMEIQVVPPPYSSLQSKRCQMDSSIIQYLCESALMSTRNARRILEHCWRLLLETEVTLNGT